MAVISSLSDQQVVLGLAVLVAALGRFNSINVYSVTIVIDLAFLASYVHNLGILLSDPPVGKHRSLKLIRTFIMFSNAAMLCYLMTMQISWTVSSTHKYLSLSCVSKHFSHDWMEYLAIDTIPLGFVLLTLLWRYYIALYRLWFGYSDPNFWYPGVAVPKPRNADFTRLLCRMVYRSEAEETWQTLNSTNVSMLRKDYATESYAFYSAVGSVEWEIIVLLYPLIYGTSAVARDRKAFDIASGLNTPGFGQIVTFVLLIVPVFVFVQSRNGRSATSMETLRLIIRLS